MTSNTANEEQQEEKTFISEENGTFISDGGHTHRMINIDNSTDGNKDETIEERFDPNAEAVLEVATGRMHRKKK